MKRWTFYVKFRPDFEFEIGVWWVLIIVGIVLATVVLA